MCVFCLDSSLLASSVRWSTACCLLLAQGGSQDGSVTCMSWFPHTETVGRDGMVSAADIRMLAVGYSSGKVKPPPKSLASG